MDPSRLPSIEDLGELDVHLFREGTHARLYRKLGCQLATAGARFAVWAPNAAAVAVVGDFNDWRDSAHPARARADGSGIWEVLVPGVRQGQRYKFPHSHAQRRVARQGRSVRALHRAAAGHGIGCLAQRRLRMARRRLDARARAPQRAGRADGRLRGAPRVVATRHRRPLARLSQRGQAAGRVRAAHGIHARGAAAGHGASVLRLWGYQSTGYFAPSARYGTPHDFKAFVDTLHQAGLGVILDWVPSHFPADAFGLAQFDGTHLYEHADPRQGFHPEWSSSIFNYGRHEVRAFLLSSAMLWLDEFHADGLRVDAVASMLYLDYSRKAGEWIPNRHGGRENLEAIDFLRLLNELAYRDHPDVQIIAEESTAWPMVSRPVYLGGLGFGMKWNMGWMHDSLQYMREDPVNRRWHHGELTFSMVYAFNENFMLPLSHDEVVHGKGSLFNKMPGDDWQRAANLRLLLGHMWTHPGKKLLFMGGEFGQRLEWNHEAALQWPLLEQPLHSGLQSWVADLNALYRSRPALHAVDFSPEGFQWLDLHNAELSVIAFLRKARDAEPLLVVGQLHAGAARRLSGGGAARRPLARMPQQRRVSLWRQRHRQPGRRGQRAGGRARSLPGAEPAPAAARAAGARARARAGGMSRRAAPKANTGVRSTKDAQ